MLICVHIGLVGSVMLVSKYFFARHNEPSPSGKSETSLVSLQVMTLFFKGSGKKSPGLFDEIDAPGRSRAPSRRNPSPVVLQTARMAHLPKRVPVPELVSIVFTLPSEVLRFNSTSDPGVQVELGSVSLQERLFIRNIVIADLSVSCLDLADDLKLLLRRLARVAAANPKIAVPNKTCNRPAPA